MKRHHILLAALALFAWTAMIASAAAFYGRHQVVRRVASPDGGRIAEVRSRWSIDPPAQSLWLRTGGQEPRRIASLGGDTDWCDQILWSPDGSRVGFLIRGVRLDVYDAASGARAASLPLIEPDGYPGSREARFVRFLDDGRVQFQDCGRKDGRCGPPLRTPS
jgi:hypothetical protein